MQAVAHGVKHHPPAVGHAPAKIDGGSLGEIAGRATHLPNFVTPGGNLQNDLVVEYKIVGVAVVVDATQDIRSKGPVAGVVFREFEPHQQILASGKHTVKNVFVEGHAALERAGAQDSGGKHHRIQARIDQVHHRRYEFGCILVVGVQHHHNVGTPRKGGVETRFLVAPIAPVAGMFEHAFDTQLPCQRRRLVARRIVGQDHLIHQGPGNPPEGLLEGSLSVVGGHNDHHFLVSDHPVGEFEAQKYRIYPIHPAHSGRDEARCSLPGAADARISFLQMQFLFYFGIQIKHYDRLDNICSGGPRRLRLFFVEIHQRAPLTAI